MPAPRALSDRLRGGVAAIVVQAVLGWILVSGLTTTWQRRPENALAVFRVPPAPPPPPVVRASPPHNARHRAKAGVANLRSTATAIVAPPIVLPRPSPVIAAPHADVGAQATSGAATIAGPGAGAGGAGDGHGSGGAGSGDGGDGAPPRLRSGRLKDSDYPRDVGEAGTTGVVGVRYLVGIDGRATRCVAVRSSGSSALDATTCRLIEKRFRFVPARNAAGAPVPAWLVETHEWLMADAPPATPG